MSTAALEHLRTGEGRNLCSAKKNRTEELYVDQVFVCKTNCIVKDLSVVTMVKRTGKKTGYSRCEDRQSIGEILIYNFGHPGQ